MSDPKRTIDFYQGLFGMPIQAHQGPTTALRVGDGPQPLAISPVAANTTPFIIHFCLAVDNFNVDRIVKMLVDRDMSRSDENGPMKVRVRMRGPENGGAKDGTPELYMGDPDGIVCQLQDPGYCGGAGALGNVCTSVEPSPKRGLLAVKDYSHITGVFVRRAAIEQVLSGPLWLLDSFVPGADGADARGGTDGAVPDVHRRRGRRVVAAEGSAPRPASINHLCLNMDGFDVDRILKTLESYGVTPRGTAIGPVGPIGNRTCRCGWRIAAARKDGTPEL